MKLRILFIFFGPPAPPRSFENTKSRDRASRPSPASLPESSGMRALSSILFQHSGRIGDAFLAGIEYSHAIDLGADLRRILHAGWKTIGSGGGGRGGGRKKEQERKKEREREKKEEEKRKEEEEKSRRKKKSLTFEGSRGLPKAMFLAGRKGFWHLKQTLTPSRLYPPYFSLTTSS